MGAGVGFAVGAAVGLRVGDAVGTAVGLGVGPGVGTGEGEAVGLGVGAGDGATVGVEVGEGVGRSTHVIWPFFPSVYCVSGQAAHAVFPSSPAKVPAAHSKHAVTLLMPSEVYTFCLLEARPFWHGRHMSRWPVDAPYSQNCPRVHPASHVPAAGVGLGVGAAEGATVGDGVGAGVGLGLLHQRGKRRKRGGQSRIDA